MQVSLQALKAFESAARQQSFKLAAQELSLSPTAISHHISNLENRLNTDLFHRKVRGVTLTETGKKLASATSEGFAVIENALAQIEQTDNLIRVATTSSLAAMVLLPNLNDFFYNTPNTSVDIITGEELDNQSYVLPVRFGDSRTTCDEDIIKRECFNLFAAKDFIATDWRTKPITILTTRWKNSQLPEPPLLAWITANELTRANITVKSFDQEQFGIQQAALNLGLVFCSTTLAKELVALGQLQTLATQAVASELCYYIPKKAQLENRHTQPFINWLEKQLHD